MNLISYEQATLALKSHNPHRQYELMYSTVYKGYVNDPALMVIPLDDHMVHRGDGVFEALRYKNKKIFEFEAHLDRFEKSAQMIALKWPLSRHEIKNICLTLVQESKLQEGMLRLFISRGFGDFSPNPYTTTGSHFYAVTMPFKCLSAISYEKGVVVGLSHVPVKPGFFAQVKSCNYLPNVLMKKESIDKNWDFAINMTDDGYLAEGPTENIFIVRSLEDQQKELLAPSLDYILKGTTLIKALEIARDNKKELRLKNIVHKNISLQDIETAQEVIMIGTTLSALPVRQWVGPQKIVDYPQNFEIASFLNRYLFQDTESKDLSRRPR